MFSFHKPKVYRSPAGCCICKAKSSSSRFTDSKKYEDDFVECFQLEEKRAGEVCNACVLLVKRWKKLPPGTHRHWRHVVDARAGPGTKSFVKVKSKKNKRKNRVKKEDDDEGDEEVKTDEVENSRDFDLQEHVSEAREVLSDASSPRPSEEEDSEKTAVRSRIHKRIVTSVPVSSFLDMSFWKREKVCCGIIFKGPHGEVIVDPRFLKPCSVAHQDHKQRTSPKGGEKTTKVYSDASSDSGYDESSNQGDMGQVTVSN